MREAQGHLYTGQIVAILGRDRLFVITSTCVQRNNDCTAEYISLDRLRMSEVLSQLPLVQH